MRRLPRSITILSQKVSIARGANLISGKLACSGVYYPTRNLMELDEEVKGDHLRGVAVHEALHAIFSVSNLDRLIKDFDKDEETIVTALAPFLLALIRDNKAFVSYLQEREE